MEITEVKQNLNKNVLYEGKEYRFDECILCKQKNVCKYSAVLFDLSHGNSTIRASLDKVEVKN